MGRLYEQVKDAEPRRTNSVLLLKQHQNKEYICRRKRLKYPSGDMPKLKRKPKVLEEHGEVAVATPANARVNAAAEIRANSKVAAFINKGNSLDQRAQREIAVLNIHKSAKKKTK